MNAAPAPTPPEPVEPGMADAWVELAVVEGRRALDQQREELNAMRTRAVAFSALTVSASAFLVGSGLSAAIRSTWFFALATIGTISFVVVAVLLVLMVVPRIKFQFFLKPDLLFEWTEGPRRAPSRAIAMRMLAKEQFPEMIQYNEKALHEVRSLYKWLLISGVTTIGVWVMIVWVFA